MFHGEKSPVFLCDCYKFLAHDKWEREKKKFLGGSFEFLPYDIFNGD